MRVDHNDGSFPQTPQRPSTNNDHDVSSPLTLAAIKEAVPEHMLEQFSIQLTRLEENYQAERAVMEQERDNHIQQALEQQRQELAAQTQAAQQKSQQEITRQFDEQRAEWKRKKEGYPLRLDSLTRERDGTQQLLEESHKEKKRMQDCQLQELRNMENKSNAMEAEKDKYEQKVKELEVCMGFGIVVDHDVRSFLQLFVSFAFYRKSKRYEQSD